MGVLRTKVYNKYDFMCYFLHILRKLIKCFSKSVQQNDLKDNLRLLKKWAKVSQSAIKKFSHVILHIVEIIKLVFFDGLYKLKFGVAYRHQKTLDFNLFLVIFIPRFGQIPFLMKKKYGIILFYFLKITKSVGGKLN